MVGKFLREIQFSIYLKTYWWFLNISDFLRQCKTQPNLMSQSASYSDLCCICSSKVYMIPPGLSLVSLGRYKKSRQKPLRWHSTVTAFIHYHTIADLVHPARRFRGETKNGHLPPPPFGCLVGKYKAFGKKISFLAWKKKPGTLRF